MIAGAGASILAIPESAKKLIHKDILEVVVESYGNEKTKYFDNDGLKSLQQKIKWADVVCNRSRFRKRRGNCKGS